MSQIPPPLSIVVITVLGPVLVGLALFMPGAMFWLRSFEPTVGRFSVVVIGTGMFGYGLNSLNALPEFVFVIGSFIWLMLMIAAVAYDFGTAATEREPAVPNVVRSRPRALPRKDRRAAKRRSRRRKG